MHTAITRHKSVHTPWGASDYAKPYGEGITLYGTPSHGGFKVSDELLATMKPEVVACVDKGGWFEEDCDWAFVALSFPDRFAADEIANAHRCLGYTLSMAKRGMPWRPDNGRAYLVALRAAMLALGLEVL